MTLCLQYLHFLTLFHHPPFPFRFPSLAKSFFLLPPHSLPPPSSLLLLFFTHLHPFSSLHIFSPIPSSFHPSLSPHSFFPLSILSPFLSYFLSFIPHTHSHFPLLLLILSSLPCHHHSILLTYASFPSFPIPVPIPISSSSTPFSPPHPFRHPYPLIPQALLFPLTSSSSPHSLASPHLTRPCLR